MLTPPPPCVVAVENDARGGGGCSGLLQLQGRHLQVLQVLEAQVGGALAGASRGATWPPPQPNSASVKSQEDEEEGASQREGSSRPTR